MKLLRAAVTAAFAAAAIGAAAMAISVNASQARADTITPEYFHKALAPHGTWLQHRTYGRVWRPARVPANWRPYTYGRWVWTEDHGWYWASDYEWGWAPFHYGRWYYDPGYGWVWLPGVVWSPAWVTWVYADDHVGWAPLPPAVGWTGYTIDWAGADLFGPVYYRYWTFVPGRHILTAHAVRHAVPVNRHAHYLRRARRVGALTYRGGRIMHAGLPRGPGAPH